MLPAGALGAERLDPQLVVGDLADLHVVLDLGQDLDQRERGVAALLRVVRADAHQAVHASLGSQEAVGAPTVDRDGRALDAGLLPFQLVQRSSVPKRWRSAQRRYMRSSISAQSVASVPPAPALMLTSAARSSYWPENSSAVRSPLVVRCEGGVLSLDAAGHLRSSGGIAGQLGQLDQVVGATDDVVPGGQLLAQAVRLAQDALRLALVVPEVWRGRPLVERVEARPAWSGGQSRPEVAWTRPARSRTSSDLHLVPRSARPRGAGAAAR